MSNNAKPKNLEMSEEDKAILEIVNLYVDSIKSQQLDRVFNGVTALQQLILNSLSKKTQISKELKFLKGFYNDLVQSFNALHDQKVKQKFSDFLSYISITLNPNYDSDALRYYLQGTQSFSLDQYGPEFIITLASDLTKEYEKLQNNEGRYSQHDLQHLVLKILPQIFSTGDDIIAIDLLLDCDLIQQVVQFINTNNFHRVVLYLIRMADYINQQEEQNNLYWLIIQICLSQQDTLQALLIAIKLNDYHLISSIFLQETRHAYKLQMCFNLCRNRIYIQHQIEQFDRILSGNFNNSFMKKVLENLSILEPKKPSEIYKEMVSEQEHKNDTEQLALADTFVSSIVNFGSSKESLFSQQDLLWISKLQDKGIMAGVGLLGFVYYQNFEEFSTLIGDYFDLKDGYAKAGACIALGLTTSGIRDQNDPSLALLMENINSQESCMKLGACIGLGLSYASFPKNELKENLPQIVNDENQPLEVSVNAALALGLSYLQTMDDDITNTILTSLMAFDHRILNQPLTIFYGVALGLIFMQQNNSVEIIIESIASLEFRSAKVIESVMEVGSLLFSNNLLKIQDYLQYISELVDKNKDETEELCIGVKMIGIAFMSIGEQIGRKQLMRIIHHLMQFGDIQIKWYVPIMITLLGIHSFNLQTTDLLYKLAHSDDKETALKSLFGLGLASAGTNNARVSSLLKNLSLYYKDEQEMQFVIRIALGLVYSGKGILTLSQINSNDILINRTGAASLYIISMLMTNVQEFIVKNNHVMLSYLGLAFNPKYLCLIDENMIDQQVTVRVGQAIDTVGQVGKPRQITGFQTHESPVIINQGDRAELGNDDYQTISKNCLEFVQVIQKVEDLTQNHNQS